MSSASLVQAHPAIPGLLQAACASIQYRLRSEVLAEQATDRQLRRIQQEILKDAQVQEVLGWQQRDGWLAWNFHGQQSTEAGIRLLCEKGVDPDHPPLRRALHALECHDDRLDRGIGKVGAMLDELGYGGSQMIRAATLARAGLENHPLVTDQIDAALEGMGAVVHVKSLADITEAYKGQVVYRPGVRWPGIYHLRVLAFSRAWRTPANRVLVAQAVRRLVELSPLPVVHVRHRSQLIAPASFAMQDLDPRLESLDDMGWMMWFHRMECLARLGVVSKVRELNAQVQCLAEMLETRSGCFSRRLQGACFSQWGAYTGLMLERDWRSPERRNNDLTFRSLLILYHAASAEG